MRNYKRKTNRGTKSVDFMQRAAQLVLNENVSLREVCRVFELSKSSLSRFIKRVQDDPTNLRFGYGTPRKIFNMEQEASLTEYLLKLAQIFHGIGPKEVRRMAYDCAIKFKISMPEAWLRNKMAGKDWMTAFLTRNTRLSIRKSEATRLSRSTSFNKTNVQEFYSKLANVMKSFKFKASTIWNVDETGVSTVAKPSKIISERKQSVGFVASAERRPSVTLLVAVSATGLYVPPMFIFPCEHFKDHLIRDGPIDCIGAGNSSGSVTNDEFFTFMQHFIKNVRPSKKSPALLILGNHLSHLSVPTLDLAEKHGVVMLSFPAHYSLKLQPLHVAVYGPFKKYLVSAQDAWIKNNTGKTMTIYDIPGIVRPILPSALTPNNIMSGFKETGIFPYNQYKFDDDVYASSFVTDRPMESEKIKQPSTSANAQLVNSREVFLPETVIPLSKAGPRRSITKKKRLLSATLTDTTKKEDPRKKQEMANIIKGRRINRPNEVNKKINRSKKIISQEEYFCLICCENYSDSLPGEDWIQCNLCQKWAHEKCISPRSRIYFNCTNCNLKKSLF